MEKSDEILREIRAMKRSLFGEDGMGGVVRSLSDLQHTVCGDPNVASDSGLVGDVREIKEATNGLKTVVEVNRANIRRAWWWLGGVSLAILAAACVVIRTAL